MAWARPGYSPPDFVGVSLHFCVLDLAMRIRTAWVWRVICAKNTSVREL